jgi:hypothetical protein
MAYDRGPGGGSTIGYTPKLPTPAKQAPVKKAPAPKHTASSYMRPGQGTAQPKEEEKKKGFLYKTGQVLGAAGEFIGGRLSNARDDFTEDMRTAGQQLQNAPGLASVYNVLTTPTSDVLGQVQAGMQGTTPPAMQGGRNWSQDFGAVADFAAPPLANHPARPYPQATPAGLGQIATPTYNPATGQVEGQYLEYQDKIPSNYHRGNPAAQAAQAAATPANIFAPQGPTLSGAPIGQSLNTPTGAAGALPGTTPGATPATQGGGYTPGQYSKDPNFGTIIEMARAQANGIALTPEQQQQYQAAVMAAAGLNQTIMTVDPVTKQLVPRDVRPGELVTDDTGMTRGVRMDLIARILHQGIRNPGGVADVVTSAYGSGGMTVDEIKLLFPYAKATERELGADWQYDTNVIDDEGGYGYMDKTPFGNAAAPIFSGFYMGDDGKYYPVNAESLKRNSWYNYGGGGGEPAPAPEQPKPPVIAGQDTPNQSRIDQGMLNQRLD